MTRHPLLLDPRGLRTSAIITTTVLATAFMALFFYPPVSILLLTWQTIIFFITGFYNIALSPYKTFYNSFVEKHLPEDFLPEESAPPVFAQKIGFVFTFSSLVFLASDLWVGAFIALTGALIAASLNAVFGYCLGCKLYGVRMTLRRHRLTLSDIFTSR